VTRFDSVHQFHSGTAPGDAITNQMLDVQRHLRRMGWQSEIFAEHIAPELVRRIVPIGTYPGSDDELLIVHHSHGSDAFDDVLDLPNPVVTMYHNITPEHFFDDPVARRYCRLGRDQLGLLARRSLFGLADSNYNRREMLAAGFRRVDVLPVRVDYSEFELSGLIGGPPSTDWLFVGRLAPNKCQHLLIEAFAAYARTFDPRARLHLVGGTSDEHYHQEVVLAARRLRIEDRVEFRGKISDRELLAVFARAGVYVSLSDHEGFGVPLLEAMAARVPVVAYASSAVPETLGGAGILLRTQDPATVAATVETLRTDPGLRTRLIDRQSERVARVSSFDLPRALRRLVERAEGHVPPLEIQVQGPFETSYSLATMNRKLALGFERSPGVAVSLFATEGPGDYVPAGADLAAHPEVVPLYRRSALVPYPDVAIRQMWPPRTIDSPGGLTLQYFAWEESRVPAWMVEDFNAHLDGIGVYSAFVAEALRDSGVTVPVRIVGGGVDTPDPRAVTHVPELEGRSGCTFLHISSAFPRKGVDVLLAAYFAAFTGSDDVNLVLKTFPNPHNTVGALLDELRAGHADPPDVRWIDRDLPDAELAALYRLADCYVHPSRGEGFGLPVAEAMLAGVPVISVAWSGLADFVSEDTAVTIPYTLVAAESHLAEGGSQWAEPDVGTLAVELARMAADPGAPEVVERAARARALIATRYSWDAVTERWRAFIDEVEDDVGCRRVAMVTSWNSRCGIAENSRYIVEHTRNAVAYDIFADVDAEIIDLDAEAGVVRTWKDRWTPELGTLEDALLVSEADVLHVQFNFGFFEFGHLAELLERQLDRRGVVVTMHRTLDYDDRGDLLTLRQIRDTLARVDQLIVHQESDARYLAEMGIEDNVTLVPIGSAPTPDISPDQVREQLGLGDRPIVGTFGFLLPHKGTLELVEAVDQLRRTHPDILLVALCAQYPNIESQEYAARIRAEVTARGMEPNVLLLTDYLSDEAARGLLRGADVIVLPYRDTGESSSAALRFVLPLGRAVAVTDQPLFDDAREAVLVMDANDVDGIARSVGRVLDDAGLREDLAARAAQRSLAFRWERVVAEHRRIYAEARRAARLRQACAG
jgi:glycosyltransferase involved in cell wall biosynthesis